MNRHDRAVREYRERLRLFGDNRILPHSVIAVSAVALRADLPIHRPEIEKRIPLFLFSAEIRKGNDGAAEAEAIARKEKRINSKKEKHINLIRTIEAKLRPKKGKKAWTKKYRNGSTGKSEAEPTNCLRSKSAADRSAETRIL